ncbi:hypothetical protein Tco_0593297, partial [Tanacetum coccineum]
MFGVPVRSRRRFSDNNEIISPLNGELKTSPGVPAYFDNRNTTLLQTLDLTVHNLD